MIFLGMIEGKRIIAAQVGKVNSTGIRLLGSAANMTSNKPALPDRTYLIEMKGVEWPVSYRNDREEMESWGIARWRCKGWL